jgi:hypothetical protein
MRRSLPVIENGPDRLDQIQIPIPCEVPWDSMPGDEQVRRCGQCKQNVYNVAALTRAEATRLLGARACLRIFRRPDNTVITADCRERLRAARKKGLWIFAGTLLVVLWAQICAQFVGMMGLKRLLGSGGGTRGAPVVRDAVPAERIVAPELAPLMGAPPLPVMGEPPPVPAPPKVHKHPSHGKPVKKPAPELKGKVAIMGDWAE